MSAAGSCVYIDGYNVIKRQALFEGLPLEAARKRLENFLARVRWPFPISAVHVVYDAPEASVVRPSSRLTLRFAPSADLFIQEAARSTARSERMVVITDDREIQHTVRVNRGKVFPTSWLMERALPSTRSARVGYVRSEDAEKGLPPAEARSITEELRRKWLGDSVRKEDRRDPKSPGTSSSG